MEQRVHFVTLSTADLDAARRFYVDGLGWTPTLEVEGEIIFLQIAPGALLGLFEARQFAADIVADPASSPSPAGLTLAHNVGSPAEVDEVLSRALAAGATLVKQPQDAAFGGYHGHFRDPNGVIWEIAHNPNWRIADDGTVSLGPAG